MSSTKDQSLTKGDAGNPLILPSNDGFGPILIGVATTFYPTHKNHPAVFTRVSSYLHWIRDHTTVVYF